MVLKLILGKILEWIVKAMVSGLIENVIKYKTQVPQEQILPE